MIKLREKNLRRNRNIEANKTNSNKDEDVYFELKHSNIKYPQKNFKN